MADGEADEIGPRSRAGTGERPVTPTSTLAFDGGAGVPFTGAGIPIATDALRLEAGFDWALSDRANLALAYSGQIAAHVQDHGLKAKLSVRF